MNCGGLMMKINKFVLVIIILSICLCCNFVIIIRQQIIYSDITENAKQQGIYFNTLQDKLIALEEKLIEYDAVLQSKITENYELSLEILSSLYKFYGVTNSQYNSTVEIEKLYQNLLFEQQQKTVSTSEYDAVLQNKRQNAFTLMEQTLYTQAHKLFSEIVLSNPNDYESRFYSVYTLFYSNPLDSRHYNKILREISDLKENGYDNEKMQEMTDFIEVEKGSN